MALEGTLKDFALPDIFQLIGLQKKTGVLILTNESDEVTIAFKDGMLVSADSKGRRLEERLGTRLVRSGIVTEGQLHDVLEKQKQTLQRIGVVLVNEGLVKKEELRKALEIQVTQIIYRVFRWEDAYYRFDQDAQIDYDRENFQPMGAESVLMEGMRILDEWPIVEKTVRGLAGVYEKADPSQPVVIEKESAGRDDDDDFDFDLGSAKAKEEPVGDAIKLTSQEGAVYQLLDGSRTAEDVMYLARLSDFDTAKAIYDLLSRELIREKSARPGSAAAAAAAAARGSELSPVVVAVLLLVVAGLVVLGAVFFRRNPLNAPFPLGVAREDLQRQNLAAISTRLDHAVTALEAFRLASGDQAYPQDISELVDFGYLREDDVENPWGVPFDYTPLDNRQGYRLEAVDGEGTVLPELERERSIEGAPVAAGT